MKEKPIRKREKMENLEKVKQYDFFTHYREFLPSLSNYQHYIHIHNNGSLKKMGEAYIFFLIKWEAEKSPIKSFSFEQKEFFVNGEKIPKSWYREYHQNK